MYMYITRSGDIGYKNMMIICKFVWKKMTEEGETNNYYEYIFDLQSHTN